ncbi:MAG: hypothetical protein AAF802_00550 [Planctomycetota bacterium]
MALVYGYRSPLGGWIIAVSKRVSSCAELADTSVVIPFSFGVEVGQLDVPCESVKLLAVAMTEVTFGVRRIGDRTARDPAFRFEVEIDAPLR